MLNIAALYNRLMQDEALVKLVLQEFFKDLPRQVSHLRDAANGKNYKVLAGNAHKLRGAAGNVGAEKLQQLMEDLEEASLEKNSVAVARAMESLDSLYKKMEETAKEILR